MAIEVTRAGFGIVGISSTGQQALEWRIPAIPLWMPEAAMQVLNDLTLRTLKTALQTLAGYVSEEAPVDTGLLAQSFGNDPATSQGGIEILGQNVTTEVTGRVFSSLPHAIVMDQGRRPGQPISRAGIDAIGLWAQRKLGMSADEAAEAKWAIAAHIVAQGIEGKYYVQTASSRARPTIEVMLASLAQEIGRQLTDGRTRTGRAIRAAGGGPAGR